jgi:hypothetical protein
MESSAPPHFRTSARVRPIAGCRFNRSGDHVADVQVNLRPAAERPAQSHAIAKRLRTR